jgi:hypothetical protein
MTGLFKDHFKSGFSTDLNVYFRGRERSQQQTEYQANGTLVTDYYSVLTPYSRSKTL